ncbi:dephospho-CoA kinase [Candidatus Pacearchaeota archaeon]|nr:dephospho-CoA kinase [Candidatus Pacearchaeota archaeon]
MENTKYMIGLLGTIGAGKTTVSDYLIKKHGFYRVGMGDLVREVTRQEGMELTRENLQAIQEKYRDKYGQEYFIRETIERLSNSAGNRLLIDGIRTPVDAGEAKKAGAVLVLIDAPKKVRYERLKARKREGDAQTFEHFLKQEKREWEMLHFKSTLKYVEYKIENSGSVKELYKKIDDLLSKLIKK